MRLLPGTFRTRLLLLVVLAVLVPLGAMAAVIYPIEKDGLHDVYSSILTRVAEPTSRHVAVWLQEQKAMVTTMARGPALVQPCRTMLEQPAGSPAQAQAREHLERVAALVDESFPQVTEIRLSDAASGRVFFSTIPECLGQRWVPQTAGDEAEWRRILAGEAVFSNFVPSEIPLPAESGQTRTGVPTWFLSAPVQAEGNCPAVLTLRLDGHSLDQELVHPDAYLADAGGRMLTSPPYLGPSRGALFRLRPALEVRLETPAGQPTRPLVEFQAWRDNHRPGERSLIDGYLDFRGERVVGAWYPIEGMPWMAVAEAPESEMLEPLRGLLNLTLALMVGIGLGFGLLAWGLSRHLTWPLSLLTDAARRLSAGDRSVRCGWDRPDEIGQLARTFDQMAGALQATLAALEEARDRALDASRAKSRFLANMSHELRTPLNAIIGYSEMLIEEAEARDDPALADLRNIHLAGVHLLSQINGILDLSKIEAGRMLLCLETFPIEDLLREVEATVAPLVRENSNHMEVCLTQGLGDLQSDRLKLRQVLLNLVGNALKFTKAGKVTLAARLEGEGVVFGVRDTGIGMTPEQCARVFEEFTQADDSTARRYGGTGLGLTLVRHFVTLLAGRLRLQSAPGQGTTFEVWLPAKGPNLLPEEPGPGAAERTTLVLLERDPASAAAVARFLEGRGYHVVPAADMGEAQRLVHALRPRALLLGPSEASAPETAGVPVLAMAPGLDPDQAQRELCRRLESLMTG